MKKVIRFLNEEMSIISFITGMLFFTFGVYEQGIVWMVFSLYLRIGEISTAVIATNMVKIEMIKEALEIALEQDKKENDK